MNWSMNSKAGSRRSKAWGHHLHKHPELSLEEVHTEKYIACDEQSVPAQTSALQRVDSENNFVDKLLSRLATIHGHSCSSTARACRHTQSQAGGALLFRMNWVSRRCTLSRYSVPDASSAFRIPRL